MNDNNNNERKTKKVTKQDYNLYALISALLATILLFTLSILSITGEDREYSENENRYLASKPVISFSAIKDGRFMQDADSYISDQFVFRDSLVSTRTKIDVFFGKREINGVYIGKHHFLFEKPAAYNEERIEKTAKTMNELRGNNKKLNHYVAIAPNASEILSNYLPMNAPSQNQTGQIKRFYANLNGFKCIDLCTPLKESKEPEKLYYKTDHHWTADAANIAFKEIASALKLDSKAYKYKNLAVTNSFQGTLASSSGIFSAKDTIYIPAVAPEVPYTVTYVNENKVTRSVYDEKKLSEKSKYDVFFGGNFSEVIIESESKSDKVLMVIKDSYANSLLPMLIPYYKKIVIVDPRYYTENIQHTIEKEDVADILWLYNANTFLNDTSISEKFS